MDSSRHTLRQWHLERERGKEEKGEEVRGRERNGLRSREGGGIRLGGGGGGLDLPVGRASSKSGLPVEQRDKGS